MSEGSLFNSGFLGASFNWWVGQIASDSTWRDNISPGKFESTDQIPGWGRRYKVRIIGLHDQGETEIPSDQLPWAQVMYPVTAGGGQAASGQTPNLRQGNMVFGFFLDGQEQQVPVIMGVLGNNAQTSLATKIGDGKVTNTQPGSLATSGYAEPADGNKDPNIKAPDEGLAITSAKSGPTIENVDAVHLQSNADTKRLDLYLKKTVMLSPCDLPGSVMKGMQTDIENLTKEIDKVLQATQSYVDAASQVTSQVSNIVGQVGGIARTIGTNSCGEGSSGAESGVAEKILSLIEKFAPILAKYMKIVFDKIFEYTLKQINKVIGPLVDTMFPNQRFKFLNMKIEITELIKCLFSKITKGLAEQILSSLINSLNKCNPSPPISAPFVPICSVEELTGNVIAANMKDIDGTVEGVTRSVETFMNDIQSGLDIVGKVGNITGQLGGITGSLGGVKIPNIAGSITSALSFENIILFFFGCDFKPNCAASDFYTLQTGGDAVAEQPRLANITEASANPSPTPPPIKKLDFDKPPTTLSDASTQRQIEERTAGFA